MRLTIAALLALSLASASAHKERPTTGAAAAISVIAHSWIDDGIENVNDEVEYNGEDGDDHHRSHDQRVVPVQGRLDEITPDARYRENRLDNDRAGKQGGRRRAGIGDDRQQRAAQRMLDDDAPIRKTERAGGANMMRAKRLDHRTAHEAGDDCDLWQR